MFKTYQRLNLKLLRVYRADKKKCACPDGFACRAPGKHPAPWDGEANQGVYNARAEYDAEKFQGYNVGIATGGGLLVVDVDPRNHGHHTFNAICEGESVPETLTVQTGGGGIHYYFKLPDKFEMKNLTVQGIDFQYAGKYAVAPPSIHHSGATYHIEDFEENDEQIRIANAPEWLLKYIESKLQTLSQHIEEDTLEAVEPAQWEWEWIDEVLAKLDPDIPYEQWIGVGMGLHLTGDKRAFRIWDKWSSKGKKYVRGETERKWRSFKVQVGKRHTYRWIFSLAAIYDIPFGPPDFDYTFGETPKKRADVQYLCQNSGALLSELVNHFRDNARVDRAEFALASALAVLSASVQGAYSGPNKVSLNLYQWCAGPAASGKDSYFQGTRKLISKINSNLNSDRCSTVQGFRVSLMAYNSRIHIRDEFHDEYLTMTTSKMDAAREILKDYKMLYNSPDELESVIIKTSKLPKIEHPYFSLLGFSTVAGLDKCSQGDFLTSGMGSRFLFWICDQAEKERWPKETPLCDHVLDVLKRFSTKGLTTVGRGSKSAEKNLDSIQEGMRDPKGKAQVHMAQTVVLETLAISPDASRAFQVYSEQNRQLMNEAGKDDALQSIVGRKGQLCLRLASLRALSDERTTVEESDFEWAKALTEINVEAVGKHFALNVGSSRIDVETEERAARILRIVKALTDNGKSLVMKAEMMKNKIMEPKQFDSALMVLIETGAIKAFDRAGRRVYPVKVERGLRFTVNSEFS